MLQVYKFVVLCIQFWQGSGIQSPWECTRLPAPLLSFSLQNPGKGDFLAWQFVFKCVSRFQSLLSECWLNSHPCRVSLSRQACSFLCYIQSQESTPDIKKKKKKNTEVLCSPLKGLFLLGRKLMKNSLHPLLFPRFIEKYYFNFVWIFLVTMGVKIFLTFLHPSRRNCAGIYCKSCKVNFQLYRFQS